MSTASKARTETMRKDEWSSYLKRVLNLQQQTWGLCVAISHIPGRRIATADLAHQAQDLIRTSIVPLERYIWEDVPGATFDFIYGYEAGLPEFALEPHLPRVFKRGATPMPLDSWWIEGRRLQTIRFGLLTTSDSIIRKIGPAKAKRHCMYLGRADRRLQRAEMQLATVLRGQFPGVDASDIINPTPYSPVVFGLNGSIIGT